MCVTCNSTYLHFATFKLTKVCPFTNLYFEENNVQSCQWFFAHFFISLCKSVHLHFIRQPVIGKCLHPHFNAPWEKRVYVSFIKQFERFMRERKVHLVLDSTRK